MCQIGLGQSKYNMLASNNSIKSNNLKEIQVSRNTSVSHQYELGMQNSGGNGCLIVVYL